MRTCEACGAPYIPGAETARYCSESCKRRARSRRQAARLAEARRNRLLTCRQCGEQYRRADGGTRYCSTRCQKAANRGRDVQCVECGARFTAQNYRTVTCSKPCSDQYRRRQRNGKEWDLQCQTCGGTFRALSPVGKRCSRCRPPESEPRPCVVCGRIAPTGRIRYCSESCATGAALDRANERTTALYRLACQLGLAGWNWRQRLYRLLVERDGGTDCYLCGEPIDLTIRSGPKGSRRGPSIDHVYPRSRGGGDELENLRLAHWGCNRDKWTEVVA